MKNNGCVTNHRLSKKVPLAASLFVDSKKWLKIRSSYSKDNFVKAEDSVLFLLVVIN